MKKNGFFSSVKPKFPRKAFFCQERKKEEKVDNSDNFKQRITDDLQINQCNVPKKNEA